MKKIVCLIMAFIFILCLCSCGYNETKTDMDNSNDRMTIIYNNGFIQIYVDNETGVQYILGGNKGVCVMVDENGNPLIYHPTEKGGEKE